MKIFGAPVRRAVITLPIVSVLCAPWGSPSAADATVPARPEAIGCKGFSSLQASALRDPKNADGSGGDLTGKTVDSEMAAGLIKSGECFPLANATVKELGQYRFYVTRVMAVLPDQGAMKLWAFYYQLHGEKMPTKLMLEASMSACQNDCRD